MSPFLPNIVNVMLRIQGDPGSNLFPETGYPEFFVVFFSPPRQGLGLDLKLRLRPLPSGSFAIHHLL
jgi:hypothetical protein